MMPREHLLEEALRNLLAQIELHTDCMDGTIDSEALVDWVEEAEAALGYGVTVLDAAMAKHFIHAWIDVNDSMPDSDETVLVSIKGASEPVWLGYHDGEIWLDVGGEMIEEVTHWTPIPEPAESEGA